MGGAGFAQDDWENIQLKTGLDQDICVHLNLNYGANWPFVVEIIEMQPSLGERISAAYPFIEAEVVYTARYEMVCTIRDFFAHRIRLEIMDWDATMAATDRVGQLLAEELGWSTTEKSENIAQYKDLIIHFKGKIR
jgi:glycerol-3-phosphate dehydrogenase